VAVVSVAQYGARHEHAAGKVSVLAACPDVELLGVYEPDPEARGAAQRNPAYAGVHWYESAGQLLGNPRLAAVAVEGRNDQSLAMALESARAGKHVWFDKPGGDDWSSFQELIATARRRGTVVQMGYQWRYHDGFRTIADWVRSGLLGEIFKIRAHLSTALPLAEREVMSKHRGGVFFNLAGHVLDQIIWVLGRPGRIRSLFRNDATPTVPAYVDNAVAILEFDRALAIVDIASMETRPLARRYEVYGTRGSAIMEPFEPASQLRLCLDEAREGYVAGEQVVPVAAQSRPEQYARDLAVFLATLRGAPPGRTMEHELLLQETLLRATGVVAGD
jgi:predicted dehydrogenase